MVWGTLISSPVDIASLGGLYFGINPNYLQSIAESKASTTVGFLLLSISFLMQIFIHSFESSLSSIYINRQRLIILSIAIIISVVLGYKLHNSIIERTVFSTYKEMAHESLKDQFEYNSKHNKTQIKIVLDEGQVNNIRNFMDFLDFQKLPNETEKEYFIRFYNYLGHRFADKIDFEKSGIKIIKDN